MKTRTVLLGAIASLVVVPGVRAETFDRATLTEVVNKVNIIEPASKKTSAARVQQLFTAPNVLRTGAESWAEMTMPDQTVARVGQTSLFSFEPNSREIQLQRGSILFQSPTGKGGGNIRTPAASAAVLGTTLIVTTTKNGGFKVLLVEGKGKVKSADGSVRILKGGQMVYALPGGKLSNILEFRLIQQVGASRLIGGFKKPLASLAKIQAAINQQEKDIASGKAIATNLLASGSPNIAFRVDVARETAIQEAFVEPVAADPPTTAVTTDAVVANPTLEDGRIFSNTSPNGPGPGANFTSDFADEDVIPTGASAPTSFLANNILFNTPTVTLPQAFDTDLFQFLAINDINFSGSTDFGSFPGKELQLIAGRTFTATEGTELSADVPQFTLLALGSSFPLDGTLPSSFDDISTEVPLELTDFSMSNKGGSLSLIGGETTLTRVAFTAKDATRILAAGDLSIEGAAGPGPNFDPDFIETPPPDNLAPINAGTEVRIKGNANVALNRVSVIAPAVRITSERVLKLTAVQLNDTSVPGKPNSDGVSTPGTRTGGVYLFGKTLVDVRGANFFANDVLVQSNTVRLEDVRFRDGSRVVLESRIGVLADNPNRNAPVQPGKVNFVSNVTYGSSPAENALIQNGPAPTPNGPGIVIRPFQGRPKN